MTIFTGLLVITLTHENEDTVKLVFNPAFNRSYTLWKFIMIQKCNEYIDIYNKTSLIITIYLKYNQKLCTNNHSVFHECRVSIL